MLGLSGHDKSPLEQAIENTHIKTRNKMPVYSIFMLWDMAWARSDMGCALPKGAVLDPTAQS